MRKKSLLYKNEQKEILNKILKIIGINGNNIKVNREDLLKKDTEEEIKKLEDDIKKYYSISKFRSYIEGKDKYLNLIKNICKENNIEILKLQGKRYIDKIEKKRETYVIYQFEIKELL